MYSEPLSEWKARMTNGNASIFISNTGNKNALLMRATSANHLGLGDFIHGIDEVHPFDPIQITLIDAIHTR